MNERVNEYRHGKAAVAAPAVRGLQVWRGCSHHGLVLRRSCKLRMNLALNMSPATVQCWAGGAGAWACGGTVCMGASPLPSCDKVSWLAALVGGREMESQGLSGPYVEDDHDGTTGAMSKLETSESAQGKYQS